MKPNAITPKTNKAMGLAGLLLAALLPVSQAHANLVNNGSFEAGNVGFTSGYGFMGMNASIDLAQYSIYDTPFTLPAKEGSAAMMVNGAMDQRNVWSQSGISVLAHTDYVFSAWVSTLNENDPVVFDFQVNGASVGGHSTGNAMNWTKFETVWNSGNSTSVTLGIFDLSTAYGGNDFLLDNISLEQAGASAVPEPASLALVAMGLSGALFSGRRRRQAGR